MLLIIFICGCLCVLCALTILAKTVHDLRSSVLAYGKLTETADTPRSKWAILLATWTVPKSYFAHFYLVGLVFSVYCWIELTMLIQRTGNTSRHIGPMLDSLQRWDSPGGSHHIDGWKCFVGLGMMTGHLTRRLLESWLIERPSPLARMHVSHYLVGIGFYGAMVFGTWLEGVGDLSLWDHDGWKLQNEKGFPIVSTLLGIGLFLYASYHQYKCHSILAALRINKKNDDGQHYRVPYGDWFEYLVAPHYTCDALIYLSLCILYQGQSIILLCGFLWTLVNLSIVASETKVWYMATFPDFPKKRWIMVPGLY